MTWNDLKNRFKTAALAQSDVNSFLRGWPGVINFNPSQQYDVFLLSPAKPSRQLRGDHPVSWRVDFYLFRQNISNNAPMTDDEIDIAWSELEATCFEIVKAVTIDNLVQPTSQLESFFDDGSIGVDNLIWCQGSISLKTYFEC